MWKGGGCLLKDLLLARAPSLGASCGEEAEGSPVGQGTGRSGSTGTGQPLSSKALKCVILHTSVLRGC